MFSNGSECEDFRQLFCDRCKKYKPDVEIGHGCPTDEAISLCYITGEKSDFPYDKLIECGQSCRYICKEFDGETEEVQEKYLRIPAVMAIREIEAGA